jgi:hypothetical protein
MWYYFVWLVTNWIPSIFFFYVTFILYFLVFYSVNQSILFKLKGRFLWYFASFHYVNFLPLVVKILRTKHNLFEHIKLNDLHVFPFKREFTCTFSIKLLNVFVSFFHKTVILMWPRIYWCNWYFMSK